MQKHIVAIAIAASALISGAVACSSSSSTGTGTGTTDGGGSGSDSGTTSDSGAGDAGAGGDSGGCVPVGAPGNSQGVGKYCTTEAPCVGLTASICAVIGGDPTEDFCTYECTVVDGGADPCGDNATCACQGGQCGCTPLSCQ
jgi:hypothetical protein